VRSNLTHVVAAIAGGKLHIFAAAIALFPATAWSPEYNVINLGTLYTFFFVAETATTYS
jgi:hypothetical protein